MKKKGLVIAASVMLVLCLAVGGTLAWLMDNTDPVVNTFTYGDVNITLDELDTDNDENTNDNKEYVVDGKTQIRDKANTYKMIPGNVIAKDPRATVLADSEDCYLFVKIEQSATYNSYFEPFAVDTTVWSLQEDSTENGIRTVVYYKEVSASEDDQAFYILKGNELTVKEGVTKEMMEDIKDGTVEEPTLTFTAYAVQKDNLTHDAAWGVANPTA